MKKINFIFILIFSIFLILEIYSPYNRNILTRKYFIKAKKISQNKNKKLMVIGDPCTGNTYMWFQKLFPNCEHGDVTIDLFGCDDCDKMDINNIKEWKKYKSNNYVIIETATLSFGKNLKNILKEIKRISGGDFFSAGSTTSIGWKYIGNKLYSKKYPNSIQNIIYPFDSLKDKYYKYYNFNCKKTLEINWDKL
jgi:hypothetical protein